MTQQAVATMQRSSETIYVFTSILFLAIFETKKHAPTFQTTFSILGF